MITATGHELSKALAARELLAIFVFDQFIEYDARPIIFFRMPLGAKNSHIFGLDLEKSICVESKWRHAVTMSLHHSSAPKRSDFSIALSLF
jgi:hypothetical protein